jgi:hypothetical protein
VQVRDWYVDSFKELRQFPEVRDSDTELKFTSLLKVRQQSLCTGHARAMLYLIVSYWVACPLYFTGHDMTCQAITAIVSLITVHLQQTQKCGASHGHGCGGAQTGAVAQCGPW